jgi:tetratricopeptide (TPR) repeat protein
MVVAFPAGGTEPLHGQGDLVGARSRFERALAIRERSLGPEDPGTAIYLDNLALVLLDQGDLLSARMRNDRAVAILEKTLGSEHPDTNVALANQSRLRLAGDVPADALSLAERALAGHEKLLGADHRRTRDSAGHAANALDALGRADEAAAVRARYGIVR